MIGGNILNLRMSFSWIIILLGNTVAEKGKKNFCRGTGVGKRVIDNLDIRIKIRANKIGKYFLSRKSKHRKVAPIFLEAKHSIG